MIKRYAGNGATGPTRWPSCLSGDGRDDWPLSRSAAPAEKLNIS